MVCRERIIALLFACLPGWALATPLLPEKGEDIHEGVASCATSVCHGKVSPDPNSTVWLNEYRVWLREDYHSRAYKTLQSAQAKSIARKMGLPAAHTAKVCLDCHADNVPAEARGRRFQVSDGVGCEACHGGGGRWLQSHAEAETSHADNLAAGMYPTEQPLARARLCLSCHLGTKDKFATHEIMGAGHPRLAFELETFTVNQPMHYEVDTDYRERKPGIDSVNMWLAGLAVMSMQGLELLQEDWFTGGGLMPELGFYQCHACHHPMGDLRWQPEPDGLAPGSVRLNDGSLVVLASVLQGLEPAAASRLQSGLTALHQASLRDRQSVVNAARELAGQIEPVAASLAGGRYEAETLGLLRQALLGEAAGGRYRHFTSAEQVFLAVETLSLALGDEKRYSKQLDQWYQSVEEDDPFVPDQFALLARKMLEAL